MGETSIPTKEEVDAWFEEEKQEELKSNSDFFHTKMKEDGTDSVTETVHMNDKGDFMLNGPDGKNLASLFVTLAVGNFENNDSDVEQLYQAAAELQDFDPTLQFTFNHDYGGNTFSYTVASSPSTSQ